MYYLLFILVFLYPLNADQTVKPSSSSSSSEQTLPTILTIYKDAALVKKTHRLPLETGSHFYSIKGIAGTIYPTTLMLALHSNSKSAHIQEYSLNSPDHQDNNPAENAAKTLELHIHTKSSDPHTHLDLLYLFKNLGWRIDYTMQFSPTYDTLELNGWIEITNHSGVDFHEATLQLIDSPAPTLKQNHTEALETESAPLKAPSYSVIQPVNIGKNDTKKINWVTSQAIHGHLRYRLFIGGDYLEDMNHKSGKPLIETWVTFINNQKEGLGLPLPAGSATLYYQSKQKTLESLGTVVIPATAIDQEVSVRLPLTVNNPSRDLDNHDLSKISAVETNLEQTEFKKLSDKITEANYRLSLKNKSCQPVSLQVVLDLPVANCKIVKENKTHVVHSPQQISWPIDIPAESEVDLKYRLQIDKT